MNTDQACTHARGNHHQSSRTTPMTTASKGQERETRNHQKQTFILGLSGEALAFGFFS